MLTIAIPTYDRNASLLETVDRLLPQITPCCRLLILDNHSPVPAEETLGPSLARFPGIDCKLIRHPYNLGGHANIRRCFELCETDYLWILGDDDPPKPHALSTILEHLEKYPEAIYFNFVASSLQRARHQATTTKGFDDLIEHLSDFGQMIWISVCVYKCAPLRNEMKFCSSYLQGICPQFLCVLLAAKNGAECHLSNVEIADYKLTPINTGYSLVAAALAAMMILDLPWATSVRRRISAEIQASFLLTPRMVTRELHAVAVANNDLDNTLYWFDQIMSRVFYFDKGPLAWVQRKFLRWTLRYPQFTNRLLRTWRFVLRRPTPESHADVFRRA